MLRRTFTAAALAGVTAAAVALTGAVSATAAPRQATPAAAPAVTSRVVTLPTGDKVRVLAVPGARPQVSVVTPHRDRTDTILTFRLGQDVYVVPRRAAVAAQRDLSRYDVSRLAGVSTGSPGVRPHFPMQTLTLNGIDSLGHRDTGDAVVVVNVDDMRKYAGFVVFDDGIAKVSVPSGHYAALGYFYDEATGGTRAVMVSQFTVTGDRSLTIDARAATARVSVRTQRPSTPALLTAELGRSDSSGNTAEFDAGVDPTTPLLVQPVRLAPNVGQLYWAVETRRFSPARVSPAYTYDLEFPSTGTVSASQRYAVADRSLGAVTPTYTATRLRQAGLDGRYGALPWQSFLFAELLDIRMPLKRTEYYTARPDVSWQGDLLSVFRPATFDGFAEYLSPARSYRPGTRTSTRWGNGQPITPVLEQGQVVPGITVCPACSDGGRRLHLFAFPFGDAAGNFGTADEPTGGLRESVTYAVSADGVPLVRGRDMLDSAVTLPRGARHYTISYDTARRSGELTTSTAVHTSWTLPAAATGGAPPPGWLCGDQTTARCRVLPLMTSRYTLGTDDLGRLSAGRHVATVTIGHLRGASAARVTRLEVWLSFNDGAAWVPVHLTAHGPGSYRLTLLIPARTKTGFGSLRITANDTVGGTITQTVQRAFAVAR